MILTLYVRSVCGRVSVSVWMDVCRTIDVWMMDAGG